MLDTFMETLSKLDILQLVVLIASIVMVVFSGKKILNQGFILIVWLAMGLFIIHRIQKKPLRSFTVFSNAVVLPSAASTTVMFS